MENLCSSQKNYIERINRLTQNAQSLPAILLMGPKGVGKRTISKALASLKYLEFIEVPVNDNRTSLFLRLFGSEREADRAINDEVPPGELGRAKPTLFFFSGLQKLDVDIAQAFHRLITTRIYVDAIGNEWRIGDDIWIVGSLTFPFENVTIGPEHWLCTAFNVRLKIDTPSSHQELYKICNTIINDIGSSKNIDESAISTLSPALYQAKDNLHSLRRWLVNAAFSDETIELINDQLIHNALLNDMEYVLSTVIYRGRPLSLGLFKKWHEQFPSNLRPISLHIMREVSENYYISVNSYYNILEKLIQSSGIPNGASVTFCKWQSMGKSNPRVSHDLKNQARWKPSSHDIDLDQSELWPSYTLLNSKGIILADDFVGSGKTLLSLFSHPDAALVEVSKKYPHTKIRLLIVAGFEAGIRLIQDKIRTLQGDIKLIVGKLFREEDQCFNGRSRIFTQFLHRKQLHDFCIDTAINHYPTLHDNMRLGYGNIGAIITFFNTVPNNSLPIIWHDQGTWFPLFPASGLLSYE